MKIGMHELSQPSGFPHDRPEIYAADAPRTRITGNFQLDYKSKPICYAKHPWCNRVFANYHRLAVGHLASLFWPWQFTEFAHLAGARGT
jgi:hypothetical protein